MNATMLAVLNESERRLADETEHDALAAVDGGDWPGTGRHTLDPAATRFPVMPGRCQGGGEYIGGWRGVYRRLLHVLDTIPMGLGWLYGLGSGRTIADTIVGTAVVRRPE